MKIELHPKLVMNNILRRDYLVLEGLFKDPKHSWELYCKSVIDSSIFLKAFEHSGNKNYISTCHPHSNFLRHFFKKSSNCCILWMSRNKLTKLLIILACLACKFLSWDRALHVVGVPFLTRVLAWHFLLSRQFSQVLQARFLFILTLESTMP